MDTKIHDKLLFIIRLTKEMPDHAIEHAAQTADKLGLDVVVFCPVVSTSALRTAAEEPAPSGADEGLEAAKQRVEQVATALRALGVRAEAEAEICLAEIDGAVEHAKATDAAIVMVTAQHYQDWDDSLTQGGRIDDFDVPIWVLNDGALGGVVLGALAEQNGNSGGAATDDAVVENVSRMAGDLGTEAHLMQLMPPESAIEKAIEIARPKEAVDHALEQADADSVVHAHETAKKWQIPLEHVHVHRASFAEEIERMAATMDVGLVVMGARHRSVAARMFAPRSQQHRVLEKIHADLLLV